MKPPLFMVIESIAQDILNLVYSIMNENSLHESSLKKDVRVKVEQQGNPVIQVIFNDYLTYIETERLPCSGRMPPISALHNWALSKGLPTDNNTLFLIAKAIWEAGSMPRPILAILEDEIDKCIKNKWMDQLTDSILKEVDTFFK